MTVTLRAAAAADCEQVWEFNFAPDVRAASGCSTVVELPRHAEWFARRIVERDAPIWMIEISGMPVGVVRIDRTAPPVGGAAVRGQVPTSDNNGRISIALAAGARGRQMGRRAITAACVAWGKPVIAEIRIDNTASRACFEACGFTERARTAELVTYHWSPP